MDWLLRSACSQKPYFPFVSFARYSRCVATSPAVNNAHEHLARIQRLWIELQAARKDPVKYNALVERIRREADAFLQSLHADDPKS